MPKAKSPRTRARRVERSYLKTLARCPRSLTSSASSDMDLATERKINEDLLRPLRQTSVWFFLLIAGLGIIVLAGAGSWMYQVWNGLAVAGISWPVFWAFYITNFVFLFGISIDGKLISDLLRNV